MKTLYESILDTEKDWDFDVLLGPLKNMFESRPVFEECLYILQDRLQKSKLRKGKRSGWMITLDFGWNANTMKLTDGKEQVWEIASIRKNKDLFIEYHKSNDIAVEQIINSKVVYGLPSDLESLKTLVQGLTPTVVHESLLDVDKNYDNDILINLLFNKDIRQRRKGFDNLLLMVESHHPKQHKTVDKMKNSDSYFIEFTWDIKDITGEPVQILDWICNISICKKFDSDYNVTYIAAKDIRFGGMGVEVIKSDYWGYIRPYFNPKKSYKKLYEVPEELNELFKQIQTEAYKHKKR